MTLIELKKKIDEMILLQGEDSAVFVTDLYNNSGEIVAIERCNMHVKIETDIAEH